MWLIGVGVLLSRGATTSRERSRTSTDLQKTLGAPGIEPS
jgi:hypothetical protein